MQSFVPVFWVAGSLAFVGLLIWLCVRMIRWAKRGTKHGAVFGLALQIPAAGLIPQPTPQEHIEHVTNQIQGRKNSDAADPENEDP